MKFYNIPAVAFVIAAAACSHDEGHEDAHHCHLLATGYDNNYEVFVEAHPLEAGEENGMLVHITETSRFKPLEKGKVTATISVEGKVDSQTVDSPERAGIYRFTLTPPAAGKSVLTFEIENDGKSSEVVIGGLETFSDEHEAHEAAEATEPQSSNAVVFPKEMSWKVDFSTVEVKEELLAETVRTRAQVLPSSGDLKVLTARCAGTVTYVPADFTEGMDVKAGEALFRIDASSSPDNNLRLRQQEASNDYEAAKKEYDRVESLVRERLATQGELTAAKNRLDNARASFDVLKGGFANGTSTVSAPFAGFVASVSVANGQYVEAGQTLAAVSRKNEMFLRAELPPSLLPRLREGVDALVALGDYDCYISLAERSGGVVSIGQSVDPSNPLVPVVFKMNSEPALIPGTFVPMEILAGRPSQRLAVPSKSLLEEMGNYFVYVQLTPEYFEKREVKTGRTNGIYTEITEGLEKGERVVKNGAVLVKLAHSSGTLDAHSGHVH